MSQQFEDKFFEDIEKAAKQSNFFVPILKKVSAHLPDNARVLDVGCGSGAYLSPIIEMSRCELHGIDAPSAYLKLALDNGYRSVEETDDLCKEPLPYASESFDAVISKDVFEHLSNPMFTLNEVKRVLKPGGLFLWHVPNHFTIKGRLKFLMDNNIDTYRFYPNVNRWELPHIRFYTFKESIAVFNKNGFDLVEDYSNFFGDMLILNRFQIFKNFLKRLAGKNQDNYAGALTILLKKQ